MDVIEKYNKTAEEYAKSVIGNEDIVELQKLRSLLKSSDTVLDVGCAAGRDTRILKDMGLQSTGSDLAEKLLDIAKKSNPDIEFCIADMHSLPFPDESFNAVWASAVLHHTSKTEMPGVLKEFWRVLALQGVLYIHTKAGSGRLQTSEKSVQGEKREFELITAEQLNDMLRGIGYEKMSLEEKPSKSRPGLLWISAFYRKP